MSRPSRSTAQWGRTTPPPADGRHDGRRTTTVVLDDDPTGTQSAAGALVVLEPSVAMLEQAFQEADAFYVQTNARALPRVAAVALLTRVRADALAVAGRTGVDVRFVLRGDSTLRGHVFAESDVFLDAESVLLFAPAFPDGGRTTRDGVHWVQVDGEDVPAHTTEYANDPVFPFSTSKLVDYVARGSGRTASHVPLDRVRRGGLLTELLRAPAGSVVIPDAVTNQDVRDVARAAAAAMSQGRRVVVRGASPLAAELAGMPSRGLITTPLGHGDARVLLVCGSHTAGARQQLRHASAVWGAPVVLETAAALVDPASAGRHAASRARSDFSAGAVQLLATERDRSPEHHTLAHGERVMAGLTTAVAALAPHVDVVITKGGITSAEVARTGLGATSAVVIGQLLPGVSAWRTTDRGGRELLLVVVPGNVGEADTLTRVLDLVLQD